MIFQKHLLRETLYATQFTYLKFKVNVVVSVFKLFCFFELHPSNYFCLSSSSLFLLSCVLSVVKSVYWVFNFKCYFKKFLGLKMLFNMPYPILSIWSVLSLIVLPFVAAASYSWPWYLVCFGILTLMLFSVPWKFTHWDSLCPGIKETIPYKRFAFIFVRHLGHYQSRTTLSNIDFRFYLAASKVWICGANLCEGQLVVINSRGVTFPTLLTDKFWNC